MNDLYLKHHGILGMKWGERNGPPYPLDAEDHSSAEKRAGWRQSLDQGSDIAVNKKKANVEDKVKTKHSKLDGYLPEDALNTKVSDAVKSSNIKAPNKKVSEGYKATLKTLGLTEDDAKAFAVALGLTVGATAALYGISYVMGNPCHTFASDVNDNLSPFTYGINRLTKPGFASGHDDKYGIGSRAFEKGYRHFTSDTFQNVGEGAWNYDEIVKRVRNNVVDPRGYDRRLSCWSAANAYFMSALTGKDVASRDFNKLVDFNKFGQLYKGPIEKFTIAGQAAKDFVGKCGTKHERCTKNGDTDAKALIQSIVSNIKTPNAKDGSIVGFINGAYHNLGCTHQWNFDIKDGFIHIADGYSGERYRVGKILGNGQVSFDDAADGMQLIKQGLSTLATELSHYNRDSIRFYSPKLSDVNLDEISKIVIGRMV